MKIAVIGGGGVRSMFLAKSLAQHAKKLGITEVVFMDNDPRKLNIFGKMAAHVSREIDPDLVFQITTDPELAVQDADYLITTIRVGEDEMRVRDEREALKLGILGQETTGASGFSFAMRSIPALQKYCELAKKIACPNVKVFNFTNPAGIVSQTLRDMGYDFTYGICDAPSGLLRSIAGLYHVDPERITGDCYGLNHLSYFSSIKLDGKELLPDLLKNPDLYSTTDMRVFKPDLAEHLGCVLNEYLYYFYYREEAVENILHAGITRGEVIRDINKNMIHELEQMDVDADFDHCLEIFDKWYGKREAAYMANETGVKRNMRAFHFDMFSPDDGGYAGVALRYIEAVGEHKDRDMILCAPNEGAIPELKPDDVVEVTCTVHDGELIPHKVKPDPIPMALIQQVKLYERLGSLAIRERNIHAAVDALMVHPLVNSYSFAETLVKQYISINKEYIGGWH
ncbi:MAG: 6-phospho-beta-glucosidase [Lachnospiraceae bacterium]|nr:6-phospho-beta-glucosidase [Lachnospiraceae bacterium]